MEQLFHLKENRMTIRTEMIAGITTFMAMAYILAVNPSLLEKTGVNGGSVFTVTTLTSTIAPFTMILLVNLPSALSVGMGLNVYFIYTVCMGIGYSWEVALAVVCVEDLIFIVLSLINVCEAIFNAIPDELKLAVSTGIGLFITFIDPQSAHIVVDGATLVTLFSFKGSVTSGTFSPEGITVLLALVDMLITTFLAIESMKGNIPPGILIIWGLGILCQLFGLYVPNPGAGFYGPIPSSPTVVPASMTPAPFKMDSSDLLSLNFVVTAFSSPFVDIFDTLGTLIGCALKADILDKNGRLPCIKGALLVDAIGAMVGTVFGTSAITTFVESSLDIAEGGRTGPTSIVVGFLFLLSLFFSPTFLVIPSFTMAPALIIVGFFVMQQISKIDWSNMLIAISSFIYIFTMPFAYSIFESTAFDIISYTVLHLAAGRGRNVAVLMYVLSFIFILKYIFL